MDGVRPYSIFHCMTIFSTNLLQMLASRLQNILLLLGVEEKQNSSSFDYTNYLLPSVVQMSHVTKPQPLSYVLHEQCSE